MSNAELKQLAAVSLAKAFDDGQVGRGSGTIIDRLARVANPDEAARPGRLPLPGPSAPCGARPTGDVDQHPEHPGIRVLGFVKNHAKAAPANLVQHFGPLKKAGGEANLVVEREQAVPVPLTAALVTV